MVSFIAVIAAMIAIGVVSRPNDATGTPALRNVVSNAGRVIALQFPESATERRERIIVTYDPLRRPNTPVAIRVPADTERERVSRRDLSDQQWTALNRLRESWCRTPPVFPPSQTPRFDVSLNCDHGGSWWDGVQEVAIPIDQLPVAFRDLIQLLPSPTCRDLTCGWPLP